MRRRGHQSRKATRKDRGSATGNSGFDGAINGLDGSAPAPRPIASRGYVRAWAWIIGVVSFLSPFALLGLSPRPAGAESASPTAKPQAQAAVKPKRPVIIVVTRKIIETQAARPSVSSSGGTIPSYSYPAAAAPAPVAVSCGTHPC